MPSFLVKSLYLFTSVATVLVGWLVLSVQSQETRALAEQLTSIARSRAPLETRVSKLDRETQNNAEHAFIDFRTAQNASDMDASLQIELLSLLDAQSIAPSALRQLSMPTVETFERRAIQVEFDASYENALNVLQDIERQVPALGVSQMRIRARSLYPNETFTTPVSVRLVVWSYWRKEEEEQQ